jgi:hypothetical protein
MAAGLTQIAADQQIIGLKSAAICVQSAKINVPIAPAIAELVAPRWRRPVPIRSIRPIRVQNR